jgi:ABC-type arginine/histidine transport system permease subunit
MRSPIWAFLALLHLNSADDFEWVVAEVGEGQVEACHRKGFEPVNTARVAIPWTPSALSQVVSQLNRTVLTLNSSGGVRGCCAAGGCAI